MAGIKLSQKIDRSDLNALRKVGATIALFFDASHKKSEKPPHFEINVWITEPQRARLAKDHWGTCKKFKMNTVLVIMALKNRLKFEAYDYDKAFLGMSGAVKDALKLLEAGEKSTVIPVKVP